MGSTQPDRYFISSVRVFFYGLPYQLLSTLQRVPIYIRLVNLRNITPAIETMTTKINQEAVLTFGLRF